MDAHTLRAQLAQFTGSESLRRHALVRSLQLTEGVAFLGEQARAHWLTDAIASYQNDPRVAAERFQVWRLILEGTTRRAVLSMTDGNSNWPMVTQQVDYTDFPLGEIALWCVAEGDHRVLMLPSEY